MSGHCSKCGIKSAADPCPQCQRLLDDIRNAPRRAPRDPYGAWFTALAAKLDAYATESARKARATAASARLIRANLEDRP